MLHILFGHDTYTRQEALEEIKASLGGDETLLANTTHLAGEQLAAADLATACQTAPFLAPARLVIVSGLLTRFEPRRGAASRDSAPWQPFRDTARTLPPYTTLVLMDGPLTAGHNPLLEALSAHATVAHFPPLRGAALGSWLRKRVAQLEGGISPRAVRLLMELVGDNLWIMSNELEKLLAYAGDRVVEEEDVKALVSAAREANIFAMIDSILQGRSRQALTTLHRLLDEGDPPPHLLAMITRQLRLLVMAWELKGQGLSQDEMRQKLGIAPYALRQIVELLPYYSMERLKAAYARLLETDLAIKSGRLRPELALDLLVAELCWS